MNYSQSKITIFGPPGSGKTTLAKKIGQQLELPIFHLDKFLWNKGWVLRPKQDFLADHHKLMNLDTWIIEGTSRATLDDRYPKSDLVIYLNPSRLVCLTRIFKRFILSETQPSDKPNGYPEKISWEFIMYLWAFKKPASQQLEVLKRKYPDTILIEIQSNRDLNKLKLKVLV
ncbi:MAG: AAA family ATPase [Alphaproteobacteria bacterium]